jgi:hypothetical protein
MNPGPGERVQRFPEFLAAGVPEPYPVVTVIALLAAVTTAYLLQPAAESFADAPRREILALALCLLSQVALYFVLPLNTNTATYVSARHALLCVLFALPLLPRLRGRALAALRVMLSAIALGALCWVGVHLREFDREAREFDPVLAEMRPNQRVMPLIFDPRGAYVHPQTFPYLHFAAYYQAARGGDLARSFALVWNVPVRYRADYHRYAAREAIEFAPWLFSLRDDLPHFDYVLVRAQRRPAFPPAAGLEFVSASGPWSLWRNPFALPE